MNNSFELRPGVHEGISNADYHADKTHLSSSNLKLLLSSPQEFYQQKILGNSQPNAASSAMDLGSYVHTLVLEPEKVNAEYAFYTGWRKQGQEFEAFKEQHKGKIILSQPQAHNGQRLAKSVQGCPPALDLLQGGYAELSIATTLQDVAVKMRADKINPDKGYILDVKTTRWGSDPDTFRRTVKELGYELSAAFYAQIAAAVYGKQFDFYWLVLSKSDWDCQVYKASLSTLSEGNTLVNKALSVYKICLQTNTWPATIDELTTAQYTSHEIIEI